MRSLKSAVVVFPLALTMLSPVTWCKSPEAKPELIGRIRVELQGLDLQNPADARRLLARIEKAAYRACGGNPKFTREYELMPERTIETYGLCRQAAVARAVDQIGAPQLSQIYKEERQTPAADCIVPQKASEPTRAR
jgi:UrcA family protein